jgi:hypothetical protein
MKNIIRSSGEQFEILDRADSIVRLESVDAALSFLQKFVSDPMQMESLRKIAGKTISGLNRMTDHEVIRAIAHETARGNVKFLKRGSSFTGRNSRLPDQAAQEGTLPPQSQTEDKKETAWIEIKLLDMNGDPVPDEKYEIELPKGAKVSGKTDAQGMARHTGIDPGTCKVTFPDLDKEAWEAA